MRLIKKLIHKFGCCANCGGNDLQLLGGGKYKCNDCGHTGNAQEWVEG